MSFLAEFFGRKKSCPVDSGITPFSSTRTCSLETSDGIPTFEQVLSGKTKKQPWVADTFLEFLQTELNEENFFFFEEVEAYKAIKGYQKAISPPDNLLLLPKTIREDENKYVNALIETFVKENAPRQVNISEEQRKAILKKVESTIEKAYEPELFEDAQVEVKRLMQHDSWPRFMRKIFSENTSQEDRAYRLKAGIVWTILSAVAIILFLAFLVPRWYFFLLFFPIFRAGAYLTSYKTHMCFENAMRSQKGKEGSISGRVAISCPLVQAQHKRVAMRVISWTLIGSLFITVAVFAITYAIEAGQNRHMYG